MADRSVSLSVSGRALLAALVVGLVLAGGTGAWASHQFSDVSDGYAFHDQIAAIAGAGITTGYDDGTYRPGATVTRGAMAAFMARGFSRVGYDTGTVDEDSSNTTVTVAQTAISPGASSSGGGFVQVTGAVTASTGDYTNCPCIVFLSLNDGTTTKGTVTGVISNDDFALASAVTTLSSTAVFSIPAGPPRTYRLRATYLSSEVEEVSFQGHISATYVPFGPTGGNTL